MLLPSNWGELLLPGLRKIFEKHTKDLPDYVATLYNVESSTKAQETNLGIGSMGLMDEWESSGGQVSYEDIHKGFKTTYIHRKYSKGLQINRELLDDDQYAEVKKRTRTLSRSVYYTRQYYGALIFNQAFSAERLGADGKPLCAPDHPVAPGSTTTFSNAGNLDLNADNLEETRTEMLKWTDDKDNLLAVNPDTLIVPPALRKAALVIADSDKEPFTQLNNVNIWKGTVDVIEFKFLTNPKAWFLVDSARMRDFLNWYDRRKANLEMADEDFDSEVAKYKVVCRFSLGWDDPTFIYGHIVP